MGLTKKILLRFHTIKFFDFAWQFAKSFYPGAYKSLTRQSIRDVIRYFFMLPYIMIILMCILFVPKALLFPSNLNEELSKFDTLKIDVNAEMKEPVSIGGIMIDLTGRNATYKGQSIVITRDKLIHKSILKTYEKDFNSDLLKNKDDTIKTALIFIALIIFPLLILFYIISVIKYIAIIFIVWLIVYFAMRLWKSHLSIKTLMKAAVYSATPMVVLEIILIPFGITKYLVKIPLFLFLNLYAIPLIIFVAYFVINIFVMSSREIFK